MLLVSLFPLPRDFCNLWFTRHLWYDCASSSLWFRINSILSSPCCYLKLLLCTGMWHSVAEFILNQVVQVQRVIRLQWDGLVYWLQKQHEGRVKPVFCIDPATSTKVSQAGSISDACTLPLHNGCHTLWLWTCSTFLSSFPLHSVIDFDPELPCYSFDLIEWTDF